MEEINVNVGNDIGVVKITEDVVSIIAGLAAVDVEGVASMSGGFAGGIAEALGKRKLIPAVSPNKTVEGSISGVIGAVAALCLYGFLVGRNISYVPYFHYIIMGILCGIISQVGDLTASTIKRYTKIKDYGNIIPGHGGVLDRFDSVLLVAPTIYFYIYYIIL
jgi:phosphatidate cytidylyltransferase